MSQKFALAALSLLLTFAAFADNVTTEHQITIGGKSIRYAAEAGHLSVKTAGKPEASIFFVAYSALPRDAKRPLTFLFNGGPGSSAIWVHMGAFGPKRVPLDANGMPLPGVTAAIPNEYSLLDVTDLVFIDPASTGLSKAIPAEEAAKLHEVGADVDVTAEFIRSFIVREKRWGSPLYVGGESYGTMRASAAVDVLMRRFSLPVTGTILISPAINTQVYRSGPGNELPYILDLPAFALTAWYHKKIASDLQDATFDQIVARSEEFAKGPYSRALTEGASLPDEQRNAIAAEMSRMIGIPAKEILNRDLRIDAYTYTTLLLKDDRRTIGMLDSRYLGYPNDAAVHFFAPEYSFNLYDASAAVDSTFAAAFNDYLANELSFKTAENYELLAQGVAQSWNWGARASNRYLYTADNLRAAMVIRPAMKVFVANGYYDLVTPHLGAKYQIDHLGIPRELRKNITLKLYPAGHMMYTHEESMRALKRDLAAYYALR